MPENGDECDFILIRNKRTTPMDKWKGEKT